MISEERSTAPLPWLAALLAAAWVFLLILQIASPARPLPVDVVPAPAPSPPPANGLNPDPAGVS